MSTTAMEAFSIFGPPYREFIPLALDETIPSSLRVVSGAVLIWSMDAGHSPAHLEKAALRPGGVALIVVMPPAEKLRGLRAGLFEMIEEARPGAVLPYHPQPDPEELTFLVRAEPESLPGELVDFLLWRGIWLDQETRRIIRRTVELSAELTTLSGLSRGVYLSRRALGRRFKRRGLPVPSHWLQFSRLLRAVIRLQNSKESVFQTANELGYPDGFTLSNQMMRLTGVRPSYARDRLGWEWFVEAWLRSEAEKGGLLVPLPPRRNGPLSPSGSARARATTTLCEQCRAKVIQGQKSQEIAC